MKECYVTKLNVEPTILDLYEEENLIKTVIPNSLDKIFYKVAEKEGIIQYQISNNTRAILDSKLYSKMLESKTSLIDEYHKVVSKFEKSGEIVYSKNYMTQRSQLKEQIDELFENHTFLRNSEEIKLPSFAKGKISEIQMGVTYIDRANRIEHFLSENKDNQVINFYYDTSKEWIYIPSSVIIGDNIVMELLSITNDIQDKINMHKTQTDIGNVSINIVYDKFKIKQGSYKEVTITKVYPNGNPAQDRGRALRAASTETKYRAAQDDAFSQQDIEQETKEDAERGYIASIASRAKNLIENTIKKVHIRED
ncbi:TPA: hypothetical protein ACF4ZG_001643 [Streptococcus pyogenes]|uniref:hypothetical protein n=2 Tax=Streptococcus pyogenes TaxID=1314 RepID=UPI000DA28044|nr:hypothetical protein [Streptococcus pyogenes]HER4668790.1 hypothetical protein [Streptococcus pyogenes NGAS401]HER4761833.1 hypothetical protein [Streptococcus pyogenes NGAS227]UEN92007.1 hypothetical protein H7789_00320 [Streptococcus pyogenes]SQF08235.1 Uncharacterised protein [Streptococcus pyogenes]VGQ43031.1 Uncharacterised protein [Streptococcus pyogenes]